MANNFDHELDRIIRGHHDALLVDIFGEEDCGLSPQRIRELRDQGFLPEKYTLAIYKKAVGHDQSLVSVAMSVPKVLIALGDSLKNDEIQKTLRAPLAKVTEDVARFVRKQEAAKALPSGFAVQFKEPPPPQTVIGSDPPKYPPGVSTDDEKESYREGVNRIGMYCRGLGADWSDLLQRAVGEKWHGDLLEPADTPNPDKRQALLAIIQREVIAEWHGGRSPSKLAETLNRVTGDYGRNWKRIAATELQALANEAAAKQALEWYGVDAEIVRVPESSACKFCKKLFLDDKGVPKVFKVKAILKNGTNVGRAPAQWKATLFPVHPHCCCLTMALPPNCKVNAKGYIYYANAA